MKRLLLICIATIAFAGTSKAQFTNADTVRGLASSDSVYFARITNTGSGDITIKWHVTATDFPHDWDSAMGICDNSICYFNGSGALWNGSIGPVFTSNPYIHNATGDFHMTNSFAGLSVGTHWLTVNLKDNASSFNKNTTFVITNFRTGVATITATNDDVVLYPNPVINELNVLFDQNADVKNITVCNVIGKVITVFKVNGNSARLDIGNIPAGIYFIRLFNSQGNIVATRKFNKQ